MPLARHHRRVPVGAFAACLAISGHALGQGSLPPVAGHGSGAAQATQTPPGSMSRGVIVPKAGIDPGMKVMAPHMPAQSTPVIHPRAAMPNDGTVIVPR